MKQDCSDPIKWVWMMDWCKSNGLAPGNSIHWDLAKQAYEKEIDKNLSSCEI